MKKLEIKQLQPSVNSGDILAFEQQFSVQIPEQYKRLLLKTNGGLVKSEDSDISLFLSLKYGKITLELLTDTHQITEQNIPQNVLPIALDYSDNPICINLEEGENYGKIVLFELDFEGDGHVIANSLEELLGVESIDDL